MRRIGSFLLFLLLCLSLFACRGSSLQDPSVLQATFLDVGQGDCTLLRTSDGDILVDCGPEAAQESLCRKLKTLGVKRIALLILTHPDEDHIGGADAILNAFPTDLAYLNGSSPENESAVRLRNSLRAHKVKTEVVRAGNSISIGDALLTFLYPFEDSAVTDENESSLVFRVQFGETAMLMMGDAEQETEAALLDRYVPAHLAVDVLHVGHHGANTSSGEDFLRAVSPSFAVISCGAGNRYGHPDGRTLARLSETGAEIVRTDLSGSVTLISDGKTVQLQSQTH